MAILKGKWIENHTTTLLQNGFNYILNPFFIKDTTTAQSPINWSDGSEITIRNNTSVGEILHGDASGKILATASIVADDYVYTAFSIDPTDKNSILHLEFDYKNLTGYADGFLEVVIHDGTSELTLGNKLIQSNEGKFIINFRSTSSADYQLRFKATAAAAGNAFSLAIDYITIRGLLNKKTPIINLTSSDSPYTITQLDTIYAVDTTSGIITINLPTSTEQIEGLSVTIFYEKGGTNDITIDAHDTETIDESLTLVMDTVGNSEILRAHKSGNSEWNSIGGGGGFGNYTELSTGFTIEGGSSVSKTLTISETCTLDQDLQKSSTPQFVKLTLGGTTWVLSKEGNHNVIIGESAGNGASTGSYSVLIGSSAGKNVTGNYNVLLGYFAGTYISSGNNNICIGRQAGFNLTTDSGCVMIGYRAGYSETESNKLYISNDTTANNGDLITGTFGESVATSELTINAATKVNGQKKAAGYFYTGATDPTNTNRLNFDGYLYAHELHADNLYYGGTDINVNTALDNVAYLDSINTFSLTQTFTLNVEVDGTVKTDTIAEFTGAAGIDVSHNTTFAQNVTVTGDLTVNGDAFNSFTETVYCEDNLMILNYGESGGGITAGFAGWQADRGTECHYRWGFRESDDTWRLGLHYLILNCSSGSALFTDGEIITGGTSTAKGKIHVVGGTQADPDLTICMLEGTFQALETITGEIPSPPTATIDTVNAAQDETQAVATRQNTPTSTGIAYWNDSEKRMDTTTDLTWTADKITLDTNWFLSKEGTRNVLIGENAGNGASTGNDCVIIGYNAGTINTGGGDVIIGSYAGEDNTGATNVYIGYKAGSNNVGVSSSIIIGYEANSIAATVGDYNVIIGYQSSQNITTGNSNVILGYQSAYNLTEGIGNIILGYGSALNSTTADNNVIIGKESAGLGVSTGNLNIIIGYRSGYDLTSGANNTLVGSQSGQNLTEGSSNVLVGSYAGSGLVTDGGCVMIGYRSGYQETGANKLYIENSNSTTPLIYGDFANDYITINGFLTLKSYTTFPTTGIVEGSVCRLNGHASLDDGLYVYNGNAWVSIVTW